MRTKGLTVDNVSSGYGRVQILSGVTLSVSGGTIVALLGANGAGKSTLLRTVSGLLKPTVGAVELDQRPLHGRTPVEIARAGVGHVLENRRLFGAQSVADNLVLGMWRIDYDSKSRNAALDSIFDVFPFLYERRHDRARDLSGGQQQILAIAQVMISSPAVIMLDEPSVGLSPSYVADVFASLDKMRERGTAVLLVEQDAKQALEVADDVYILQDGRIRAHLRPDEVDDAALRQAYLGAAS